MTSRTALTLTLLFTLGCSEPVEETSPERSVARPEIAEEVAAASSGTESQEAQGPALSLSIQEAGEGVRLEGEDRFGNALSQEFENHRFVLRALPVLSQQLGDAEMQALIAFLAGDGDPSPEGPTLTEVGEGYQLRGEDRFGASLAQRFENRAFLLSALATLEGQMTEAHFASLLANIAATYAAD